MKGNNVFYGFEKLSALLTAGNYSAIFVLVDENTSHHCYPLMAGKLPAHKTISIKSGEENKTLETCQTIWQQLTAAKADRKALLINLGGGVIGDMGGFAAGCYKRGIAFINIPTTLLAMVDASVGAKCGIDFMGFKNQLGLFNEPQAVFIHTPFLKTLPQRELHSGFAEVIKHYLIADTASFHELLNDNKPLADFNFELLVRKSVSIKQSIVEQDPHEQGIRKALNFGHTIGHAIESFYLDKPNEKLLHGEAIALGMLAESFVSVKKKLLSERELKAIEQCIRTYFQLQPVAQQDFEAITALTTHDKKNEAGQTLFTLLNGIGSYTINQPVEKEIIHEAMFYVTSLYS
jgi:3-dehydroquinate synthase